MQLGTLLLGFEGCRSGLNIWVVLGSHKYLLTLVAQVQRSNMSTNSDSKTPEQQLMLDAQAVPALTTHKSTTQGHLLAEEQTCVPATSQQLPPLHRLRPVAAALTKHAQGHTTRAQHLLFESQTHLCPHKTHSR